MALNNKDTNSVTLNIDVCIFTVESSSEKLTKRMRKKCVLEGRPGKQKAKRYHFTNKLIYQNLHSSTKIPSL